MPEDFSQSISPFPPGVIVPFYGSTSDIPSGWSICDGSDGTPNLLDKFVKSIPDGNTEPGSVGGSKTITLSGSQIPSHSHSGTTGRDGHAHNYPVDNMENGYDGQSPSDGWGPYTTSAVSSHNHNLSVYSSGNGESIENQPEFVEMIFIQKL
jgi:microcystin-dependent protein